MADEILRFISDEIGSDYSRLAIYLEINIDKIDEITGRRPKIDKVFEILNEWYEKNDKSLHECYEELKDAVTKAKLKDLQLELSAIQEKGFSFYCRFSRGFNTILYF